VDLRVGGWGRREGGKRRSWLLGWSWRDDSSGRALAGPATDLSESPSQVSAILCGWFCVFFFCCCPMVLIRACGEHVRDRISERIGCRFSSNPQRNVIGMPLLCVSDLWVLLSYIICTDITCCSV
jgi:hypothetical protein